MSLAEEMLENMPIVQSRLETVEEPHIVINESRQAVVPDELRIIAVTGDKDIETIHFDCVRYWDGYDLSTFAIYFNYVLSDRTSGTYIPKSITTTDGDNYYHFDWVIEKNITQKSGKFSFAITAIKTKQNENGETVVDKQWSSLPNADCSIALGLDISNVPNEEETANIVSQMSAILEKIQTDIDRWLKNVVVQSTGESETAVMSQKAVTEIAAPLIGDSKYANLSESNKHTQGYITANGTSAGFIITSGSWQSYLIYPVYDKIEFTCYNNDINGIYAVAFYNVSETPNEKSFISGIKIPASDTNAEQKYNIVITNDMIPKGTKSIVLCSRTATGGDTSLLGCTVKPSEFSKLLKAEKGRGNVKAVFNNIPNTNDFTIVKDEIWFAENIYQDGVATEFTTVHRYKIEDGELVHISDIDTDFGHWNCVDYNEENDCLVFGNAGNTETTEGNFFAVVKNPLGLGAIARLETCGIKYPVDIGYKVQAVWGDSNWGKHNIVYLMSNNGRKFVKVLLLKDANGDFNGNYVTLETHETETDLWIGGADFWGDTLYVGGGAYYISEVSMTDYSMKRIWKHFYKDDGTEYSGSTQGIHIDSRYIWVFSNVGGSSENYLVQYYR